MPDNGNKKSGPEIKIQLQQGSNSLAIIGNTAPVDLNIRQTVHVHNGKVNATDSSGNPPPDEQPAPKKWPDPQECTVAKVWTNKDGCLCLSAETRNKYDGKVEFPLNNQGEATHQMRLIMLLCHKWPMGLTLSEIIRDVYPEEMQTLRGCPEHVKPLLKRLRTLVSDIRNKKLVPAGINPDIITPLGIEVTAQDILALHVAKLNEAGNN